MGLGNEWFGLMVVLAGVCMYIHANLLRMSIEHVVRFWC
jgi:hypothetical protein